ncbi:MAG TPA: efflux RND transporter periplasmic adaptor subunit [Chthoniobacteraceae bacterium]|jgi:Cu(I)/Ag(I) efflux system membrane fusion protein
MKISLVVIGLLVAAAGGWWLGARHDHSASSSVADSGGQKIKFYQSPMHPWVKSEKPGTCTVCGMELVPVREGGSAAEGTTTDIVMLPEGSPNIAGVKVVEVKRQPLARTLRVAGTIDDDESRHRILSAYSGGRIEKLFVNFEGAEVEAGQPLVSFYSKELLSAVREYKIAFKQGPSPLLTASEMRLQQLGMSKAQIAAAPQRDESDIFVEILAPITGTVVKRYVYEGQYVQEGEKLFELADFSTMWFQFVAYEQDLPFLKEGLPVTISTPSLPGRALTSTIKFINPTLDGATRSARVRVEVKNPMSEAGLHRKHEVLHKLYADATVTLEAPEVVAVPRNAVLWTGREARVYVEQSAGSYQQRRVILGRSGDEFWEVLEGVKAGERVVASGGMLIDGQAQLNNLAAPVEETIIAHDPAAEMNAAEHGELEKYLAAVAALTEALASDNLGAFNAALSKLPAPPKGLTVMAPKSSADLVGARKAFLPLSESVAEYAKTVRGHFPKLKIFRCPMTDQAGEGMPKNAKWIQLTADLRNPFFGREMIDCGAEVK